MPKFPSLDVDAPDKVAPTLRAIADLYRQSAIDLESSWQAGHAGRPWYKLATILDRAAASCERVVKEV